MYIKYYYSYVVKMLYITRTLQCRFMMFWDEKMAGTSRHITGSQHVLTAELTTRNMQKRTYPNPISRLMHYLHCVDLILDLSSIPFIKEYM